MADASTDIMFISIMRVIEPRQFKHLKPIKRKRSYKGLVLISLLALIFGVGYIRYNRALPDYEFQVIQELKPGPKAQFTWPEGEQASIGIVGKGVVASNNSDKPVPTASTIKILTALMVLNKKPLKVGEDGPNILITELDQQIYDNVYVNNGSRVLVEPGTSLTQKQALQALLLPSANNIAETLTNWAFGSEQEYVKYTKEFLADNNLTKTTVVDASGFSPDTKSTAYEMTYITDLALKNPVITEIIAQKQAEIPISGVINNTNWLLGKRGIDGVKTGHTDQSGGCFIVSANVTLPNNKTVKVFGTILGASDVDKAMLDIQPLVLEQVLNGYRDNQVITKGQKLGVIKSAWGEQTLVLANSDLFIYGWQESKPTITFDIQEDYQQINKDNTILGNAVVKLDGASSKVYVGQDKVIKPPSFWWKFKRIFQ